MINEVLNSPHKLNISEEFGMTFNSSKLKVLGTEMSTRRSSPFSSINVFGKKQVDLLVLRRLEAVSQRKSYNAGGLSD